MRTKANAIQLCIFTLFSVLLAAPLICYGGVIDWEGEHYTSDEPNYVTGYYSIDELTGLVFNLSDEYHFLEITGEGEALLDGKQIEKLGTTEIKLILKDIVRLLYEQFDDEEEKEYLYRQTENLLKALEECHNKCSG